MGPGFFRIYVAGPMSGYEPHYNFSSFDYVEKQLIALGHEVENPASTGIIEGWEWSDYLRSALTQLLRCDKVALLPGWESSKGARLEVDLADRVGIQTLPWKLFLPGEHSGLV